MATNTKPPKLTIVRDSLNRWQVTTHNEAGASFHTFTTLGQAMSFSYSVIG